MFELIMLIALLALMVWSAWIDNIWIAAAAIVLYAASSWLFGELGHLAFLADPITLMSLLVCSFGIGTIWSLWKWRRWMLSDAVQSKLKTGMLEHAQKDSDKPFKESIYFPKSAQPSHNVERIVTWITLWPFSMVVYFFEDFLVDVGRWIYRRFGMVYVRITDAAIPTETDTK